MFQQTTATRLISALVLLCGCSSASSPWFTDSILAGDRAFNSSRLRYRSANAHSPLTFELVKMGMQIEAFISLTRFRLPANTKIQFTIANLSFEDPITVHEGGMRLRLSTETTQRLIQALQEGHKIAILLNDFEEILDPQQFSSEFVKFLDEGYFFQNLIKGPIP